MKRRAMLATATTAAFMLVIPIFALAQEAPPAPAESREAMRENAMRKMRTIRIADLQEQLNLDEKTTIRLNDILRRHDDEKNAMMREIKASMGQLKAVMSSASPDNAQLTRLLDKLLADKNRMNDVQNRQIAEVRKILTPIQQARFVLQMDKFRINMRDMIRRSWMLKGGPAMSPPGAEHIQPMGPAGMGIKPGPVCDGPGPCMKGMPPPPPPPMEDDENM
ncbi:MAG: hypothetical protein WC889_05145 [Myxococcota bacterium]|jgi:Spy/CpxP family protein refolding chaperone